MGPDESDVGDGGVRERYEGLGWETFDVTDNIDIDGDLFGPLLDMDYDDALDKELMATTSSPSNIAMTRGPTPELSVTPLPNALGSAGQERGRDSGENNGTSGTSWHQALEESSSPSSVSVGLESPKGRPFRLAQTRKPCGSPQPPPVNRAFSAPNAEDGPFGGVTKSRTSQGESGAKQLGISRKRKTPVGHLSPANEDCPHQQAKFAKIARDKARRHVYQELEPSSMGAERSGRVTMLSCERQLRSNPIAPSMAEQVSNRIMLQKIEARRGAFEDNRMEQCRPSHGVPSRQHHQQLQQQQLQKNQFGGVKTPMKPSISAALTPSPPSRIPRSPLLNRPVHTLPFLSVAAAAAAPKAVSSTTSRRPSFPPLEGRDPNVEVSTTDENAAGGCSFVHEMEKILFAWDPSEVKHQQQQKVYRQEFHKPIAGTMPLPLSNMGQQQQQTMERFCGNAVRNRSPASVYPGELGLHQEQRLFHQQQKLELEQMQRVHEQQIQQNHLRGVKTPMSSRKPLGSAALTSSPPVKAFCCIPISPLRGPPGQGLPFRTAVSTEKAATTGGRGASSTNEAQNLHTPPRRPSFPPL